MISLLLLAWFLKTTFLLSLSFGEPESKVLTLSAAFLAMANCFLIDGFSASMVALSAVGAEYWEIHKVSICKIYDLVAFVKRKTFTREACGSFL